MESLSAWVLSIIGIVFLSVLLDLFIPDGEMNGHIKTTMNFIVILVIILPFPKLLNQEINIDEYVSNNEIEIQYDFLYQLNNNKISQIEELLEDSIKRKGLEQVEVIVSANIFDEKMQIELVYVDLKNIVILDKDKHIDIKKEVTACILDNIDIKKELIVFNE